MRAPAAWLLILTLVGAQIGCDRHEGSEPAPARGPVLVTIVVDQLAAWIADERWPLLPTEGGFARLVREGTLVRQLRFAHAGTDTAPGHAALHSGATPRVSGIFANERLDDAGKAVSILLDPESRVLTAAGAQGQPGASTRALRVETLADRLRAAHPDAMIASFSVKDRGAIFGCGRHPDACLWYDRSRATFVSSTAFAKAWPSWIPSVAAHPIPDAPERWDLLDPAFVRDHAATPDAEPGEGDFAGLGITFPHALPSDPANAFRVLPRGDEVLLELGVAAIDQHLASNPRAPMLLALSLSTFDYVGHVFGPDSWESWDELRRLDAALGRFFAALDERLGTGGWAALLSADHGVATLPEALAASVVAAQCATPSQDDVPRRSCVAGARVLTADLARSLDAAAAAALGPGRWLLGVADPYVFYGADARALPAERRSVLDRAIVAALFAHPEVERAIPAAALPRECPLDDDSIDALICTSFPPDAGDVYFALRAGAFVDPELVPGKGTSHGSPHAYDRTVPLVVRAPGRVAAGRRIDGPLDFRAFPRTAAALLGIDPLPDARIGQDLTDTR